MISKPRSECSLTFSIARAPVLKPIWAVLTIHAPVLPNSIKTRLNQPFNEEANEERAPLFLIDGIRYCFRGSSRHEPRSGYMDRGKAQRPRRGWKTRLCVFWGALAAPGGICMTPWGLDKVFWLQGLGVSGFAALSLSPLGGLILSLPRDFDFSSLSTGGKQGYGYLKNKKRIEE